MDSGGFEPPASAQAKAALYQLSYEPVLAPAILQFVQQPHSRRSLGGDPAADSPTATLLRLNPPCET
jgi:hypothetical protein